MDAFMFYVDDWVSSGSIDMMDAFEERGYLRLLLRAAKQPDCGLPDDDIVLASWSMLDRQWWKPTKDPLKRLGKTTSGEKLRERFFNKEGRLFNDRLLKERTKQEEYHAKRSGAAKTAALARWGGEKDALRIPEALPAQCVKDAITRWGSSFEVLLERSKNLSELTEALLFDSYWDLFVVAGKALSERDRLKTGQTWCNLDRPTQELAFQDALARVLNGSWPDADRTQYPFNHLADQPWTRVAQQRTAPTRPAKSEDRKATEDAAFRDMAKRRHAKNN